MSDLGEVRSHYARLFAAASESRDPRIEEVAAAIPREDFLGPGPWTIVLNGRRIVTPSANPAHLYANVLVALDEHRNNGEPFLHAAWIGKAAPKPGETVTHIGAGTGYYTAMLAHLVTPGGKVHAFEIEPDLAERAQRNLQAYDNVEVICGDAVRLKLPKSDIIYVNAGVVAPPVSWLKALKPGGRLIFPWRPTEWTGLALMVTRTPKGFACDPFMRSWFIPCVGAPAATSGAKLPTRREAESTRSVWLTAQRPPDKTATAIIGDVWFSTAAISGQ